MTALRVCLRKSRKGKAHISPHRGRRGLTPNAPDIFRPNQKAGNCQTVLKGEKYMQGLKEKLITNLEPKYVLVIDNDPYHVIRKDKAPGSNSSRKAMKNWLREKHFILRHTIILHLQLYEISGPINRSKIPLLLSRSRLCHYSVGGAWWHLGFYESF
jgi:hypothetical protein